MPVGVPLLAGPYDAAPILIVFWRVVVASMAMLVYLAVTRQLKDAFGLPRRTIAALAGNGVLLALHWFLFFSALVLTEVSVAELLTFTGPIYVAVLTPLVLKERFDPRVLMPIAIALAGIALVLGPDIGALAGGESLAGAAMAMLAAVVYGFLVLNAKRLLRGLEPGVVMFWESVVAALLFLPLVLMVPSFGESDDWLAVLTLGLVHSGIVAFVFLHALKRIRADHAAVLMYVEPVTAVLLAALLLDEPLGAATLVGGVAVVAGGVLVARLSPTPGVEVPFGGLESDPPAD